MENKETPYRKAIKKRNGEIAAQYDALMKEGYRSTVVIEKLKKMYGLYSNVAVYACIRKGRMKDE